MERPINSPTITYSAVIDIVPNLQHLPKNSGMDT